MYRASMLGEKSRLPAVFISDLHLHPNNPVITERFNQFIDWAGSNTSSLYILGDFFHVWPGDDGIDEWSRAIAKRLKWLSQQNVAIYFMHGNRDFLLGADFAREAGMTIISEPYILELGGAPLLLVHGDKYCTQDKSHQWFRKLTRNKLFPRLFLQIPFSLRNKMVSGVRQFSQSNRSKSMDVMNVVPSELLKDMQHHKVTTLIHGHTHQAGLTEHQLGSINYRQYVLSDWDDIPKILCYDHPIGLQFAQIQLLEDLNHDNT